MERISAIAYSSGPLRRQILRYKYDGKKGWALIFGRILLGWLNKNRSHNPPDLIVANPTFVPPMSDTFEHTELVLRAAAREDVLDFWPFDIASPTVIIKTRETNKSAGSGAVAKRAAAEDLRRALSIPDRRATEGRRILVYDDVCTTGSQVNAVADVLLAEGGASAVEALVLARAPWRARS